MDILPLDRRQKLEKRGLATFRESHITYEHISFTDIIDDPEEQVRADLYLDLVDKYGYSADIAIEMEKYYKIGHPRKKSDAKLDILVKYRDGKPFMLIELKAPDKYEIEMEETVKTQLFNIAAIENQRYNSIRYLLYHTRYYEDGQLFEKTVCIDYAKYKNYEDWDVDSRINLRAIPKDYGVVRIPKFIKGGEPDLRKDVRRDELQRIRKDLHNILWGGGKYQNELFFNLVGLFLVKIYDEKETEEGTPYKFQIFFENGEPESANSIYERINRIYLNALKEYLGYDSEQIRKTKDIAFDSAKVRYVVEALQDIAFTFNKYDVIGDFFEGIVRGEFKQSKGQYLTHTNIVKFMAEGLQLHDLAIHLINEEKRLPYIIDPACGSGAFIIESMKRITDYVMINQEVIRKSSSVIEFFSQSFPEHRRNAWAKEYIYGIEINGDLATAAKVNMVGYRDGSANIEAKDALIPFRDFSKGMLQISKESDVYPKPVNEQFDAILSNPPFSITVDRDTARTFPSSYIQGEKILSRLKKQEGELEVSTELLFIERYYQILRPYGRLAVVLPESIFDTSANRDIRLFLLKYFRVLGIISLPEEAFAPYTTTKTCILFAEKKTTDEITLWNRVWMNHSGSYRQIREQIKKYLEHPPAYLKIKQILDKFEEQTGVDFDDNVVNDLARAVLEYIQINKESEDLLVEVAQLIVSYFEDLLPGQQEILNQIIHRKRSLIKVFEEYIQLVHSKEDLINILKKLLGDFFDEEHKVFTIGELLEEYSDEIRLADEDWWVFRKVCTELPGYKTVLARAKEIGYKRGVRGEENRPNELFILSGDKIVISRDNPCTILDEFLSSIQWRTNVEV